MPKERRSATLEQDTPRVDHVVQSLTGASRAVVRGMFDHGCVTVDGVPCAEAGLPVARGAVVEVVFDPRQHYREKPPTRPNRAFRVAFEDSHVTDPTVPAVVTLTGTVTCAASTKVTVWIPSIEGVESEPLM